MDFQHSRQEYSSDNISVVTRAIYTSEEYQALHTSGIFHQPCIARINPTLSLWRLGTTRYQPTFRELHEPGIMFEGFAASYADDYQNTFEYWYGGTIRKNLDAVLQAFRRAIHQHQEYERDVHFGARPALPDYTPQFLLPPKGAGK